MICLKRSSHHFVTTLTDQPAYDIALSYNVVRVAHPHTPTVILFIDTAMRNRPRVVIDFGLINEIREFKEVEQEPIPDGVLRLARVVLSTMLEFKVVGEDDPDGNADTN